MFARALAEETRGRDSVRVTELIIHPSGYISAEAGDGGPIDGPAVGRYVAGVIAGQVTDGPTVHLESPEQLAVLA